MRRWYLLALMTSAGHDMAMKTVRIAELKARLSEYLRSVRKGQRIVVLDRETPIANLIPYEDGADHLTVRPPAGRIAFGRIRLPAPFRTNVDVVRLLLEERQGER